MLPGWVDRRYGGGILMTEMVRDRRDARAYIDLEAHQDGQQTPVSGGPLQRLLPVGSAAKYLGVSRATVERLVHRGDLATVKIGRSTRYDVEDLDGFIETNRRRNHRGAGVTLRDLIERKGEGA
jgi:excisionase family DNA binding protein